ETFLREVPLLAEHFPWHHIFGFGRDAIREFLEAGYRSFEECPERECINFLPRVEVDLHFLPRSAKVLALHSRAPAIGFDLVDVVERLEVEIGDKLAAVEG